MTVKEFIEKLKTVYPDTEEKYFLAMINLTMTLTKHGLIVY